MLAMAGCGLPEGDYFGKVDSTPDPTHLRFCNSGEPEYVDPALVTSTTGLPVTYVLFDGLTDHDLNGLPEPSLASHWDISPDQRRFTFHLHDQGRWSNGRPITAHDVAFQLERVLDPLSFSQNAEALWKLKGGQLYTEGRIKMVRAHAPPFVAGEAVEVLGYLAPARGLIPELRWADAGMPSSNLFTVTRPLALRDLGADEQDSYARVPAGSEVTLVDLDGPGGDGGGAGSLGSAGGSWAYVHWAEGDGVYGWVPAAELGPQPAGEVRYLVRTVSMPHRVGVDMATRDIPAALAAARPAALVRGAELLTLPEVLGIRVPDAHTLVLETWGPVPYLIDMTSQRMFRPTPREAVSRAPLRWTRSPATIVTSGPFHLAGWYERDRIELFKSPTYWRADTVKLERVTLFSMNDQAASTNYYMQGGCDAVASNHIPASYLRPLSGEVRGRPYRDFISAPYLGIYFYLINTDKLDNVHLRRALSQAVDRSALARLLHGGHLPTTQHVPGTLISQLTDEELALCGVARDTPGVAMIVRTGELCYVPPPGLEYDADQARAELALAKQELGAAFPGSISLKFNTGNESHKLIAEYMQHEWQDKLGLKIELSSQEWKTYLGATVAGEYEVGRFGNVGSFPDPESEFLSIFRCQAPQNRSRFCNREFEDYFNAAEATADRKQRLALIRKAEEVLVREAPVIPLYVYSQHQLQKPYVRDMRVNLSNKQPLGRVWIDPHWPHWLDSLDRQAHEQGR